MRRADKDALRMAGEIMEAFYDACEKDGFGDVKNVDIAALTRACERYKQEFTEGS